MINEAVDLLDAPRTRARAVEETDLVAALGERVKRLVERHRTTRRAVDELGISLVERDRRIVELDAKLAGFERLRAELLERIDSLVGDLDRLERSSVERSS